MNYHTEINNIIKTYELYPERTKKLISETWGGSKIRKADIEKIFNNEITTKRKQQCIQRIKNFFTIYRNPIRIEE